MSKRLHLENTASKSWDTILREVREAAGDKCMVLVLRDDDQVFIPATTVLRTLEAEDLLDQRTYPLILEHGTHHFPVLRYHGDAFEVGIMYCTPDPDAPLQSAPVPPRPGGLPPITTPNNGSLN